MENINILYFIQLFVFIPIMLSTIVAQHLRIPIQNYSLEQIVLFGYIIILYCTNQSDIQYIA
jgi:hypothetical protein